MATVTKWALPLTTLVVIPKCPACIAGYIFLLTGIGVSLPVAASLRAMLIALSMTGVAYLIFRAAGSIRG